MIEGDAGTGKPKRDAASAVFRADRLPCPANPGKVRRLDEVQHLWRQAAADVRTIQWRLLFEAGAFDPHHDAVRSERNAWKAARTPILEHLAARYGPFEEPPAEEDAKKPAKRLARIPVAVTDPLARAKADICTAAVQMVRPQVVGMLRSFLSNRANDFAATVEGSTLKPETKRLLHAVNRAGRWYDPADELVLRLKPETENKPKKKGRAEKAKDVLGKAVPAADGDIRIETIIPQDVRKLARRIMKAVLSGHRRPSVKNIGMVIAGRIATLEAAKGTAAHDLWLRLRFPRRDDILLPLKPTERFNARTGRRATTYQVGIDRDGRVAVAVVTDIQEAAKAEREAYAPKVDEVSLDFGLRTLFATDRGDLLGRDFIDTLKRFDRTITAIARHRQRTGSKPRESKRYRDHVRRCRDFIRMEVNRCLNRVVAIHAPKLLIVEKLDFRNPDMSRRMNRLVTNCGRAAVRAKLQQLLEIKGISSDEVPAAYSSRECLSCAYVDPRNRNGDLFRCRWCGHTMHADVHAARVIAARRSRHAAATPQMRWTKAALLEDAVRRHDERHQGRLGTSPDPRTSNRYYREADEARSRKSAGKQRRKAGSTRKSE